MRRVILFLLACLILIPAVAGQAAMDRDPGYWRGYVTAVLQREMLLDPSNFQVDVRNGCVTVVLRKIDKNKCETVRRRLLTIKGLSCVSVKLASPRTTGDENTVESSPAQDVKNPTKAFPVGDLFTPLIADPKQPEFFFSFRHMEAPTTTFTMAAVGYGEKFGLVRWGGDRPGNGFQFSMDGGLFAQFNMDTASHDLINADYTVGMLLTYRRGSFSTRVRLHHQSSHLGDEYLLQFHPRRINLSYEELDAIASQDMGRWRLYGGGGYRMDRDPASLEPWELHAGLEYRGTRPLEGVGRFVAGLDLKSFEQYDWAGSGSLKFGLEFGNPNTGRRHLRLMAEYYRGYSPFGQFYLERIRYYGLGLYFSF